MPSKYPRITIITPSLNQADFIGETVESVLSQNYPDLEYIIMDGGSKDGTLDILKKFRKKIRIYSEKDKGQSDAINKGLKKSTGKIIAYLNADDIYEPDCLKQVAHFFAVNPEVKWVTGKCRIINKSGKEISKPVTAYKNFYLKYCRSIYSLFVLNYISQPSTFWRRELLAKAGYFDESLYYSMDYDYWLRIGKIYESGFIDEYLASFRVHPGSKSEKNFGGLFAGGYEVCKKNNPKYAFLHRLHDLFSLVIYKIIY